MILTSLILGAGLIIGGGLVASFWNNIIDWLKRAVSKVKEIINSIVYGTRVFIRKFKEAIKEISKHYSQDEFGRWKETIVTREISEDQVPTDILAKAQMGMETDITNELELKLS